MEGQRASYGAQHVPGLTDQRFEGQIVRYLPDKGYGFIRCQELRQSRYPDRDIFLHQKQLGNFKEGDAVSFGILLNRDGKPTATELAYLNGGGQQQQQQPQQYQQQYDQQYQQQYSQQYQQQPQQQQQYEQQYQQQYQQYPPQYQQQSQDHYGMQGMQAFGGQEQAAAWEPQEEEGTHEVEVPKDVVSQLEGGRLHQLKQMAGGDIQIAFQTKPDHGNAVAVIRGPQAHASLGAILVMQELCDLVQIPV
ncbi:unnamed protein product [Durusdinium trenchii]|uniref:Uncharacterized protein n=2 Tax=Durusdinium trenchii TaxID=1381693 RepID=A0ABP0JY43_9DINO